MKFPDTPELGKMIWLISRHICVKSNGCRYKIFLASLEILRHTHQVWVMRSGKVRENTTDCQGIQIELTAENPEIQIELTAGNPESHLDAISTGPY